MSMEWLKEQLAAIWLRISLLFTRGIVTVVYKVDADKMQKLQASGLDGDLAEKVEHFEPYGLACNPLPGSEAFLLSLLGQRSHLLAFVADPRKCPTDRKPGEVILWSKFGQRIWLHDDGGMTLTSPAYINGFAPDITLKAENKLRLEGDEVEVYATTSFAWDVYGHGQTWYGDYIDNWTIGQQPGSTYNISPPTYLYGGE
jgi:phage baseplate assembly protein V